MRLAKRLLFLPFVAGSSFAYFYYLRFYVTDLYKIFAFDVTSFQLLILLVISCLLLSLFVTCFMTLTSEITFVTPVLIMVALTPFLFVPLFMAVSMFGGVLLILNYAFYMYRNKLATYLTFSPVTLLMPTINTVATGILLFSSVAYFFAFEANMKEHGFTPPKNLVDIIVTMSASQIEVNGVNHTATIPQLTKEQIDQLKQHPELLAQYGLTIQDLEEITKPQVVNPTDAIIRAAVEKQLTKAMTPYTEFIPTVTAILFFITLKSLAAILIFFIRPLVFIIFWLLEKTGVIHFEKEMREVKKLVI